ncbi:MAG: phospholipase [Bacteroidaceae bacterium]|nr:phospholipase [Bacteroidaceae bacterium]
MIILVISIVLLGVIALIAGFIREKNLKKQLESGEISEMPTVNQADSECCGQHEVCEKESLLAAVSKDVEYYNDEELDRYRGVSSDKYDDSAVSEFREVLYTMKDDEVAGWVRSLQLRSIELPDELKDEVILIVGERRFNG